MHSVSVVIPTLNRHASLGRAMRSVLRQSGLDDVSVELIVVDNSADWNARATVEAIAPENGISIRLINEPRPGVANARNAGARLAKGDWVAFLDDDEEADAAWLSSLLKVAVESGADAVFGEVSARAEGTDAIQDFAPYFSRSLRREDRADITDLAAYLGTNNSMFNRHTCLAGPDPFDPSLNTTGGEDSLLLKRMALKGRRYAWAPLAKVVEWVPERRLSWNYVRKRKFASGQIRMIVLQKVGPAQWASMVFWLAVGLCQMGIGGLLMAYSVIFHGRDYERGSILCAAGLGKVFWMPRFRPALYGLGHVS